jgi:hypothetical protein
MPTDDELPDQSEDEEPDQPDDESEDEAGKPEDIIGTARRVIESLVIAIGASTGLYLVGSVYTGAYYGRMSMEVTALDLAPPFIALQSAHVVESLVQYPMTLLFLFLIYRIFAPRLPRVRGWFGQARDRFGRLFLLIVNVLIVLPLLISAFQAALGAGMRTDRSVLGDVSGMMGTFGFITLIYLIWLSFGPRDVILNQIRNWKIVPIALLFALYLLDALIATAHRATLDAELLMTGVSDASVAATFTPVSGADTPLPEGDLILVTARNGNFFVVEQQSYPPSERPISYAIPFSRVSSIQTQRINPATVEIDEFFEQLLASPVPDAFEGE